MGIFFLKTINRLGSVRIIGLALQHVPSNSLAEVKTKVALQLVFRLIIVNKYMILR